MKRAIRLWGPVGRRHHIFWVPPDVSYGYKRGFGRTVHIERKGAWCRGDDLSGRTLLMLHDLEYVPFRLIVRGIQLAKIVAKIIANIVAGFQLFCVETIVFHSVSKQIQEPFHTKSSCKNSRKKHR